MSLSSSSSSAPPGADGADPANSADPSPVPVPPAVPERPEQSEEPEPYAVAANSGQFDPAAADPATAGADGGDGAAGVVVAKPRRRWHGVTRPLSPAAPPSSGPHADDPADAQWQTAMAVRALTMGVTRFRAAIADALEVSPTDVLALTEIALHPGLTPGELADRIAVGIAGTSAVIDRLVTAGFVRRVPSSTDRRTYNLTLSPAGVHAVGWIADATRTVITDAHHDLAAGATPNAANVSGPTALGYDLTPAAAIGTDCGHERTHAATVDADATVMHLNALSAAYYRHADTVNAR